MQFTDAALLLSLRKFSETSAVVRAFTREHGVYAALVRGAQGKNRGIWQPGNTVILTWKARLAEQMGGFTAELIAPGAALFMDDAARLAALSSAAALVEMLLPEREAHPRLYAAFSALLQHLRDNENWRETYARFELALLSECGFRLDLTCCAATGTAENLAYVSPKSGRAVSREAGAPWQEKMLPLPSFLLSNEPQDTRPDSREILAALRLTGYFLAHWLLGPHEKSMPAARTRLAEYLQSSPVAV